MTWSREISRMSKILNFEIFTPLYGNLKMLHFDANPIWNGYLVTELWAIYQCWKQYQTKESELFFLPVSQNNICDIRLIPLDHVTIENLSFIEFNTKFTHSRAILIRLESCLEDPMVHLFLFIVHDIFSKL